jgi:hypothetical protein
MSNRPGVSSGGSQIGSGRLATPSPGGIGSPRGDSFARGKGRAHRSDGIGSSNPGVAGGPFTGAVTPVGQPTDAVPDKIGGRF